MSKEHGDSESKSPPKKSPAGINDGDCPKKSRLIDEIIEEIERRERGIQNPPLGASEISG